MATTVHTPLHTPHTSPPYITARCLMMFASDVLTEPVICDEEDAQQLSSVSTWSRSSSDPRTWTSIANFRLEIHWRFDGDLLSIAIRSPVMSYRLLAQMRPVSHFAMCSSAFSLPIELATSKSSRSSIDGAHAHFDSKVFVGSCSIALWLFLRV